MRKWIRMVVVGSATAIVTGYGALHFAPYTVSVLWFMAGVPLGTLLARVAGDRVNYWIHPDGGGPVILAWSLIGAYLTWTLVFIGIFAAVAHRRQRSRPASERVAPGNDATDHSR